MVDKEMLMAMEELLDRKLDEKLDRKFDEKLKPVNCKLDRLEISMKELKTSVKKLDRRTSVLETSMKEVKVSVKKLDRRTSALETSMKELKTSVKKLEADVKEIKVDKLENNVIPRLSTIERCYLDTYRRYVQNNELIEKMAIEVNALVKTVQGHSALLHAT